MSTGVISSNGIHANDADDRIASISDNSREIFRMSWINEDHEKRLAITTDWSWISSLDLITYKPQPKIFHNSDIFHHIDPFEWMELISELEHPSYSSQIIPDLYFRQLILFKTDISFDIIEMMRNHLKSSSSSISTSIVEIFDERLASICTSLGYSTIKSTDDRAGVTVTKILLSLQRLTDVVNLLLSWKDNTHLLNVLLARLRESLEFLEGRGDRPPPILTAIEVSSQFQVLNHRVLPKSSSSSHEENVIYVIKHAAEKIAQYLDKN